MKKTAILNCLLLLGLLTISACAPARAPVQPGTIPQAKSPSISDEKYGHTVLNALSKQYKLDYSDPRLDQVERVVERLTKAAGAGNDPWHIALFDAPKVKNAAATRGNHLFVWSGMLDIVESDAELATILGHEIAHVLARHTEPDPNEQIRKILIGLGATAAGIAVSRTTSNPITGRNLSQVTQAITQQVGSGFLVNPHSREREAEADHIGLFLMAKAKYEPREALKFWNKLTKDPDFKTSVEFFSTHPLAEDRFQRLEALMPEARRRYLAANTPNGATKKEEKKNGNHTQNSKVSSWRVTSSRAVLYSRPNSRSKALGEFSRGASVEAKENSLGWLEVSYPDRGFLKKRDLLKLGSK